MPERAMHHGVADGKRLRFEIGVRFEHQRRAIGLRGRRGPRTIPQLDTAWRVFWQLSQEARRDGGFGLAEPIPDARMRQDQLLARPCDADVAEPAFLLNV